MKVKLSSPTAAAAHRNVPRRKIKPMLVQPGCNIAIFTGCNKAIFTGCNIAIFTGCNIAIFTEMFVEEKLNRSLLMLVQPGCKVNESQF